MTSVNEKLKVDIGPIGWREFTKSIWKGQLSLLHFQDELNEDKALVLCRNVNRKYNFESGYICHAVLTLVFFVLFRIPRAVMFEKEIVLILSN